MGIGRALARAYASLNGYFWLPCPLCGEMFGGHEYGKMTVPSDREGIWRMCCKAHDGEYDERTRRWLLSREGMTPERAEELIAAGVEYSPIDFEEYERWK